MDRDATEFPGRGTATAADREAALRDILSVLSLSREDDARVFDVILTHARRLCAASFAGLYLVDEAGTHANLVASPGARSEYLDRAMTSWPLDNAASVPRAINSGAVVHIPDLADTDLYRDGDQRRVEAVDIEGIRSFLAVPLIGGEGAIGCIGLSRRDVAPFL